MKFFTVFLIVLLTSRCAVNAIPAQCLSVSDKYAGRFIGEKVSNFDAIVA